MRGLARGLIFARGGGGLGFEAYRKIDRWLFKKISRQVAFPINVKLLKSTITHK